MGIFSLLFGRKPKQPQPEPQQYVPQEQPMVYEPEPTQVQPIAVETSIKPQRYKKPKYNGDCEEFYKIIATLDDETCTKCGKMDLRIYRYSEMEIGVNYPPFCKNCRCVVAPWVGDEYDDDDEGKRFARDENGNGILVSNKMTWTQWRKIYGNKRK